MAYDAGGNADGNGVRRQVVRNHGACAHDATVANRYSAEHGDARTEPDVATDFGRMKEIRLGADDGAGRRDGVVGGEDAALHRDQRIGADLDAAVAVDRGARTDINPIAQTHGAAMRVKDDAVAEHTMGAERDVAAALIGQAGGEIAARTDTAVSANPRASGARMPDTPSRGGASDLLEQAGVERGVQASPSVSGRFERRLSPINFPRSQFCMGRSKRW